MYKTKLLDKYYIEIYYKSLYIKDETEKFIIWLPLNIINNQLQIDYKTIYDHKMYTPGIEIMSTIDKYLKLLLFT